LRNKREQNMKTISQAVSIGLGALALGAGVAAQAAAPVITSFSGNGVLACSNLAPGSVAAVEWASAVTGPWTNNWAGLEAVTADSNGMIQVSVPMFYRVRGINSVPPGMVLIPAGSFTMGNCMDPGEGDSYELPLHTVYVSGFYMDRYEVTKALWDEVYEWATNRPPAVRYSFESGALGKTNNHPAQSMTWYDAVKWCNARSEREGRVPAYYTDASLSVPYRSGPVDVQTNWVNWSSGYRLPTEAEWEKAARGGASGHRFPWSDSDTINWSRANYYAYPLSAGGYAYDVNATSGFNPAWTSGGYPYTTPVGTFAANGYGLYDMAGNVWEWCWDGWGSYSSGSQTDPRGPASGSNRVLRGGSWGSYAYYCRAADRYYFGIPAFSGYDIGFRSVLPSGQ
jgi:formylglycine-generating enzyme required for sulfatase activity